MPLILTLSEPIYKRILIGYRAREITREQYGRIRPCQPYYNGIDFQIRRRNCTVTVLQYILTVRILGVEYGPYYRSNTIASTVFTNYLFREKGNFREELPIPRVIRGLYLEEDDSDDDIYISRDPNQDKLIKKDFRYWPY
jgi:hypothetical protein